MRSNKLWIVAAPVTALLLSACGDSGTNSTPPTGSDLEVSANLTADTTWKTGNTYILTTHIFVEQGTLTIEPGTTVKGGYGTSLVVTENARLRAEGSATAPIVFTSIQAEATRAAGDWGGVVLLGKAPINVSGGREKIEGFPSTEDLTGYGGSDAAHNCGSLEFARIEFAGFELATDNELNGLTLAGCGSQTTVDFVQVHKGADDGVEIFGGNVNLKHLVITQADDDGLDWDFGWTGKLQYLIVQQSATAGNNAIEADNNKNNNDAEPRSKPTIWNATLIGANSDPGTAGKEQFGILFRRGTAGNIHNMILTHFTDFPVDVTDATTSAQAGGGQLSIEGSIFFDNANSDTFPAEAMDDDQGFDEGAFFGENALANRLVDPLLADMLNIEHPNCKPMPGSPALTGAAEPPADGFFDASSHVGAVGAVDWAAGWTAYPAN